MSALLGQQIRKKNSIGQMDGWIFLVDLSANWGRVDCFFAILQTNISIYKTNKAFFTTNAGNTLWAIGPKGSVQLEKREVARLGDLPFYLACLGDDFPSRSF
jgi:hypothetical protein